MVKDPLNFQNGNDGYISMTSFPLVSLLSPEMFEYFKDIV